MRRLLAALSMCLFVALLARPVLADVPTPTLPIPASDFPAKSQISYAAIVSNVKMDSAWNFGSGGGSLFHTKDNATMGRVTGWNEEVDLGGGSDGAVWIVWSSTYKSAKKASAAVQDFIAQIKQSAGTRTAVKHAPGGAKFFSEVSGTVPVYTAIFSKGTIELEAACADLTYGKGLKVLVRSFTDAIAVSLPAVTPSPTPAPTATPIPTP